MSTMLDLDHFLTIPIRPSQLLILIPVTVVAWLLYHGSIAVYNAFLHPLAGYPGPRLAGATSLWYAKALARGTIAQDLLALHEQYGEIVRITPDEISYINPDNWKEIYNYRSGGKVEMIKDPRYHDTVKPTPTILTGDRDQHSYFRKILSPPFSERSLREQDWILHNFTDKFIQCLHAHGQDGAKTLNMVDWWNFYTFDIMGFVAYGEEFNCLSDPSLRDWIHSSLSVATLMALGQAARQLPYPFDRIYKAWAIPKSVFKRTDLHRKLVEEKVKSRLSQDPKHADVLAKMVNIFRDGDIGFGTLWEHASLLTIGGSETTATLLAGATYWLAANPQQYAKLTAEIRGKFATDNDINLSSLAECSYLLGVIEEALRVYPPSPANHTRMVPEGGAILQGRFVPERYCVGMPMYASFNATANWVEPERFAPERWTGDAKFAIDKKMALQPFSFGPRNCLGRQLATQEIRLALAKMAWHFDLELDSRSSTWGIGQRSFTFWEKPDLWVKMIPARR